jgi:hypothetical protein
MAEPTKQGRGAGVYLFGLVPADADVAVERCPPFADDRAVHLVRTANLCALAASVDLGALGENGPVDLEPERLTALVEDHDRVLREVAASGRALVPAPFGTVVGDVNALRQLLERHCADLHDALTRLEGCDEWGVHVSAPREAPQRAVRSMAYQVHERLAACAEDAVIEPVEAGAREARPSVLSAAFLVNRDRAEHFRRTVADLERYWDMAGGTIRLSGPWPAYHFARVDLGTVVAPGAAALLGPLSDPQRAWVT